MKEFAPASSTISLIIAAAGSGRRMGGVPKPLVTIGRKSLLLHCLTNLGEHPDVRRIVIASRNDLSPRIEAVVSRWGGRAEIVEGGSTRAESVRNALKALEGEGDLVAVHDAARPLATGNLLSRVAAVARSHGAAVPALPLRDTVKRIAPSDIDDEGVVAETLSRSALRAVQTPQVFRHQILSEAYASGTDGLGQFTDDASVVEASGHPVHLVRGEEDNIKITSPRDLHIVRSLFCEPENVRVGLGYDSHRLVAGRPLVIGGVRIASPVGLYGHSDADVLLHALADALLGAAALGDIGHHFPPEDVSYRDADSAELLSGVVARIGEAGFAPINADATVVIQSPRLAPHISDMVKVIAGILGISRESVSVKASTDEGMGPIGRGEGAAAWAVCSLRRRMSGFAGEDILEV
ncbi:MAG: 2-C-methyl-D-erythritol 4-phosphate cytidylyltransferase [Bacillota bacterium]